MNPNEHPSAMSRRGLLRAGGLTISLGAVIAACGSEEGAPGRVGNAPVPTPLPTLETGDDVYLRTAMSLIYTVRDLYARMLDDDALSADATALIERFDADHEETAAALTNLVRGIGGTPYECPNRWYEARVLPPLLERIDGNEDAGIPPTDDVERDYLELSYAFESIVGATHQQLVELLSEPQLRREVAVLGTVAVRHAAAVAILRTGAPDGYISPVLYGQEIDPTETDLVPPLFAVPTTFGSLAPVTVVIGAENEEAGTRFETSIETPADNSYAYNELTCEA